MPALATDLLHGGPHTLGFLMTSSGVGALTGALYLASRRTVLGLGRVMMWSTIAFGAGLVAFSFARTLWLALAILPIVGAGMMITMAATNTILQTVVQEDLRGRVMAFYTMAFLGTAPIGSLLAGVAGERIGPTTTIFIGGLCCLVAAGWFSLRLPALRLEVRPVYLERGIIAAAEADASTKVL
jgi:MFS family permease